MQYEYIGCYQNTDDPVFARNTHTFTITSIRQCYEMALRKTNLYFGMNVNLTGSMECHTGYLDDNQKPVLGCENGTVGVINLYKVLNNTGNLTDTPLMENCGHLATPST